MLRQIIRYNSKWHRQQRIRDHKFYSFYICTYHGHYLCCAENAIISEYNSPCNTNYELKYFHWNMLQEFAVPIQSKVQHNGKFRLPYRMQLNLLQNRIYLDSKTIFLAYHLVPCLLGWIPAIQYKYTTTTIPPLEFRLVSVPFQSSLLLPYFYNSNALYFPYACTRNVHPMQANRSEWRWKRNWIRRCTFRCIAAVFYCCCSWRRPKKNCIQCVFSCQRTFPKTFNFNGKFL